MFYNYIYWFKKHYIRSEMLLLQHAVLKLYTIFKYVGNMQGFIWSFNLLSNAFQLFCQFRLSWFCYSVYVQCFLRNGRNSVKLIKMNWLLGGNFTSALKKLDPNENKIYFYFLFYVYKYILGPQTFVIHMFLPKKD